MQPSYIEYSAKVEHPDRFELNSVAAQIEQSRCSVFRGILIYLNLGFYTKHTKVPYNFIIIISLYPFPRNINSEMQMYYFF